MQSWKLFSRINIARNAIDSPVYLREANCVPVWYDVAQRVGRFPSLRSGVAAGSGLACILGMLYVNNLLFLLIPPLAVLLVSTGLSLGAIVARERVSQNWPLMLVIPDGVEEVLLNKAAGALTWMRHLLLAMTILLGSVSIGVALSSLKLIPTGRGLTPDWPQAALCGAILILPTAAAILFIIDRAQQYVLMIAAALAASTSTASVPVAILGATTAVMGTWLLDVVTTGIVLLLQPGGVDFTSSTRFLTLTTLGPLPSYIMALDAGKVVLYCGLTLVVRELLIGLLWRLAVRRARVEEVPWPVAAP